MIYGKKCDGCGGRLRHMAWYRSNDLREIAVCGHCGEKWPSHVQVFPRGTSPRGKPNTAVLDDLVSLRLTIECAFARSPWGMRALLLYAGEEVGGERVVASRCAEQWPGAPFNWSRRRVRQLLSAGRRAMSDACNRSGFLDSTDHLGVQVSQAGPRDDLRLGGSTCPD